MYASAAQMIFRFTEREVVALVGDETWAADRVLLALDACVHTAADGGTEVLGLGKVEALRFGGVDDRGGDGVLGAALC